MNDRELLEMAAKAAGFTGEFNTELCEFRRDKYGFWCPLSDDNDSEDLASRIGINSSFATKREIVLAAAKIGRSMP